jgi:Rrf2 family nitric oxide-sensitive transcriptional repressor
MRGRGGGIRLARPAAEIGLGAVVRALEPELALVECQAGAFCAIAGMCKLQNIVDEAAQAMLGVLDKYKLADVAGPHSKGLRRRLGLLDQAG